MSSGRTSLSSSLSKQASISLGLERLKLKAQKRRQFKQTGSHYHKYQDDPVTFAQQVLEETFTGDIIKVMESVRDNPVTVAQSANSTGKTHGAARIAIWFYKCFPNAQVYTTAAPPEGNLKKLLWGEIGSIATDHPKVFDDDRIINLHIEGGPKEFITGVAIPQSGTPQQREAKFSGKHAPNLLFIVDEGDAVPDEIYTAIESSMSGGHSRLLVMFNPRAERGEVYRMIRDQRANVVSLSAFNHPNVVTGEDVIPGAVSREKTVTRINAWTRTLMPGEKAGNDTFEVPTYLIGTQARSLDGKTTYPPLPAGVRKITNPAFSYMVLGEYPPQGEQQLIHRVWLDAARSRYDAYVAQFGDVPPIGVQPVMGQDVAEFGDDSNVACFRYGGWVAPLEYWGGMDTDLTATKAAGLYKDRRAQKANIDATGVGSGVAPKMSRNGCKAHSIKVASSPTVAVEEGEFHLLRDQLWWLTREWLRTDPGAMLPPDERLLEDLNARKSFVEDPICAR
ncbi:MAG: hypothetical protein AAF485_14405 [Chloroflexota bacterium]